MSPPVESTQSFTFAQLTDPHLTSLEGVGVSDLLNKRLLGYLSWRHTRKQKYRREVLDKLVQDIHTHGPDHIVITGDLTQVGLPAEFQEARHWLDSLGLPEHVTVIPGNHEAYALRSWDRLLSVWEPYLQSDSDWSTSSLSSNPSTLFPTIRIRGEVAFIGLSSAYPSLPFLAVGKVDEEQLHRFSCVMENLSTRNLFRVILIHHPPVPGSIKWRKRLTNAEAFQSVMNRYGAELVLHGHSHRLSRSHFDGLSRATPVIGLPAASRKDGVSEYRAGYNLYQVTRKATGWELKISTHILATPRDTVCLDHEEVLVMGISANQECLQPPP